MFWALTAPAVAVAAVAAAVTLRRRRVDVVGLLVLSELAVTITLSLVTRSPRVAAVREPLYTLVAGAFCLATLVRRPFTHATTVAFAGFGDPAREATFARAWVTLPDYRRWQRFLTTTIGAILAVASVTRLVLLLSSPAGRIAHAVDVSTAVGTATYIAVVLAGAILIQPVRRITERLLAGDEPGVGTAPRPRGGSGIRAYR